MHEALSLFAALTLSPVSWIIVLIVASLLVKKTGKKKLCGLSALIIFLIFGNSWLLNTYAKFWQGPTSVFNDNAIYSCGIVLGGFGSPDENEQGHFNSSSDRFIQTLKLYKTGKIQHLLISGGNGKKQSEGFNEATWAKEQFTAMGVPDSVILVEDFSNNTADNIMNTKNILDATNLKPPYVLITSAYHIPRATLLFNKAGINIIPYPSNYVSGKETIDWTSFLPRTYNLISWEFYMRETAGYLFYKVR